MVSAVWNPPQQAGAFPFILSNEHTYRHSPLLAACFVGFELHNSKTKTQITTQEGADYTMKEIKHGRVTLFQLSLF